MYLEFDNRMIPVILYVIKHKNDYKTKYLKQMKQSQIIFTQYEKLKKKMNNYLKKNLKEAS